jgi:opacity protein-like surface antigen
MRSILAGLLALATLLAPAAGRAQPVSSLSGPGPDTWIELHLGGWIPQSGDLDVVDPGYAFGGEFGARFTPYLGVEAGIGYVRATGREPGVAIAPDFPAPVKLTVSDLPLTVNLKVRGPWKVVEPFLAAGVGLHVASLSTAFVTLAGTSPSTTRTAVAFGAQVSAGIGFHLSPTMLVGAAVERTFVEPKFDGTGVRLDALRAALTLTYHL